MDEPVKYEKVKELDQDHSSGADGKMYGTSTPSRCLPDHDALAVHELLRSRCRMASLLNKILFAVPFRPEALAFASYQHAPRRASLVL
jgi:hypothetical protein